MKRTEYFPLIFSFLLLACALAPRGVLAQSCPPATAAELQRAWKAYRADSIAVAVTRFRDVIKICPNERDAQTGLGFALLRTGDVAGANSLFDRVLAVDSASVDAWEGRARSSERGGNIAAAVTAWRRLISIDPARADARTALNRLGPGWERPETPIVRRRSATLNLTTRVKGEGFEILRNGAWQPFHMRGVNMGLAMPGKFPSEFPTDSAVYAHWFDQIGAMNANTLRIYTVLPPEFYRALRAYDLAHADRPLYALHGVWTELPPKNDFDDPEFNAEFQREIHDVIDVLHGAAHIPHRAGHASGNYDADVSQWIVGYTLGREWEPYSVILYNQMVGKNRSYDGRYLRITDASPTDVWMVRNCDLLVQYEVDTYNSMRPISYTNWPTTDPIVHTTETSYDNEMKFRGLIYDRDPTEPPPHEEEGVSLDPSLAHPTAALVAGWFAAYHIYPYYPDFMLYDPGYNKSSSSMGRSNYFGYLQDLKRHHAGIPLVVAEFGIPSSRSTAHLQPQGWNHGGVSESDAAKMIVRLGSEIEEAGAAGEFVFAWIDEWFKRNWFTADFQIPADRGRMWHNILSPEQHYGLLAIRPGAPGTTPLPGGDATRWRALPVQQRGTLFGKDTTVLRVGQDEGFLYLALETPSLRGHPFPWDTVDIQIGIDTYRRDLGQTILPISGIRSGAGFEFMLQLNSPTDAQLLVLPEYNLYMPYRMTTGGARFGDHFRRPIHSVLRDDAVFDSIWALTNRPRFTGPGQFVPGQGVTMGRLQFGTAEQNSIADWYYDQATGTIQIRLPWLLINVSDPSSRSVVTEVAAPGGGPTVLGSVVTDGMTFGVTALSTGPRLLGTIPHLDPYGNWPKSLFPVFTWKGWEEPTWHEYLKPAYFALQQAWAH